MDRVDKTQENLLRRMAERRGFRLERSRRRDTEAVGYGLYRLVDVGTHTVAAGNAVGDLARPDNGYALTLHQIAQHLLGMPRFHRVGLGDHVDAEPGSVITVKPGVVLDMAADHGRRFVVEEDGSLQEIEPGE